jgi:spore maturation protein CgeB
MEHKCKLLIISNECLSNSSSNGRTLKNFLIGWDKEKIAQFCVKFSLPDYSICNNYYYVSDKQAIYSLLRKEHVRESIEDKQRMGLNSSKKFVGTNPKKRNAVTMLLRDIIWQSNQWMGDDFLNWVENFSPDIILLQAGDNGFMLKLARNLSEKYNLPLIIYNSENYYFKEYDYFRATGIAHWFYPIYRKHFHKQFDLTMKRANKSVYICETLQEDYDRVFGLPSETIYTATEMKERKKYYKNHNFRVSYLGNVGVGRSEPLIEIAKILHELDSNCYLDVYGKIPDISIKKMFDKCNGIRCKGFVSYDECVKIMHESDLIVHAENFSPFFREGLKRAFSTKIADSLACGTSFLLYAPEEIACSQYLKKYEAAFVATSKKELKEILTMLYNDPSKRLMHIKKAKDLVKKNHSMDKNARRFQKIIMEEYLRFNGKKTEEDK